MNDEGTMRDAKCRKPQWYLSVLRERGRKGLPCTQLYRQMFNKDLYLLFVDRTSGRHAGDG